MQHILQRAARKHCAACIIRRRRPEAKVVRCTQGRLYDVAVDLRPDSPAYKQWVAVVLTERRNRNMLYIPEGCAHGFLTLEDETEVFYQMSEFYEPGAGRGVRWDDPHSASLGRRTWR